MLDLVDVTNRSRGVCCSTVLGNRQTFDALMRKEGRQRASGGTSSNDEHFGLHHCLVFASVQHGEYCAMLLEAVVLENASTQSLDLSQHGKVIKR